ncbi:porin [Pikeienuella piscinae]|uniref:Porin n=1 Tax=Pikeienuella piscinae TaxID=2748098 RepID=A0A7L5BW71_9RHOB|nr:porin [Pikeienuella piscinae]QIE55681.1 porin [Pikeienuella piscinae]
MKFHIFIVASIASFALGAPAMAGDLVFTDDSGASATLYGQINLTYQGVDDGEKTYNEFVDNSNSTSRVGLWVELPVTEGLFRFNFETGLGLRNTAESSQNDNVDFFDWRETDIRKGEGVFVSDFGSLWLGQGSMATDGLAEIDNSGTTLAGYVNLGDTAGSFQFRNGAVLSGTSIGSAYKDFDGARRMRVRYDTPDFRGFMLSAAYGQEVLSKGDDADYYDAAIRYGLANDTIKLDAGLGYAWKDDSSNTEQIMASGSVVHLPTGLNITLSGGMADDNGGEFGYVKVGWKGELISFGPSAISVDYYDGADFNVSGSDSSSWGIQAVQNFTDLNLEAYAGYRSFSFDDDTGANYHDIGTVLAGARWRF